MSVLASLVRAYDRLPDAPRVGFSEEKIGAMLALNPDGSVAGLHDLRGGTGKKRTPALLRVPQAIKRTAGIAPNFLWDKTAYTLGVTAGEGKRTADEHAAFVEKHREWLAGSDDPGLVALLRFFDRWTPDQYEWDEGLRDQNIVFVLESDRMDNVMLHDRPAARTLWAQMQGGDGGGGAVCLVTGQTGPVARLHPAIKGVWGAQSSGASLVSFNLDAFESYGHAQGDNAPVSDRAAFAYGAALNGFLAKGSGHRVQIGDASTVFWAEAPEAAASAAEEFFEAALDTLPPTAGDDTARAELAGKLEMIRQGKPMTEVDPQLAEGVRFTILGLAPNAARLSVRFLIEDDFAAIADRYRQWQDDIRVEPGPRDGPASLFRQLCELAVQGKVDNLPPRQGGDYMRAILTGGRYPMTTLSTALTRIRADGRINAIRVGLMKAVLIRNFEREVPMALDPEFEGEGRTGYHLGRLFAVYEQIQRAALGDVNAGVRDKYYGSASATPRKVFAMLDKGAITHLSKIAKKSAGLSVNLTKTLRSITDRLAPGNEPFPQRLTAQDQAMFALGYHHQHSEFFRKKTDDTEVIE
ncbi:MAG: type I-C CRISPR-associated protein Cas8c/Csd1 [Paracoccus sp. (in: a-proteobacteria)]|uniref:type I-C CRISPR-associated protein Cas8c/Csd1 n=1 Tax=Paracoccus sp. TaxID=267 RepID=UPI0026DFD0F0|nr:type I-C CRISPR-associated protein Cas8c/Csd1 [Paracoccus sp. (in: a-proteobacteria)]MDO5620641.1 type I-C CRISPR-associated protein Cas8c/Csd1 [Paracoccus sp. (in: a-proteobacteria)]